MTRSKILSATVSCLIFLTGPVWSGQGKVTAAKLDEVDLYEDSSLKTVKTVQASEIPFPLEVEEATDRAVKVSFGGHSYWMIRGMVDTEGVEAAIRKGTTGEDPTSGTRGIR